MIRLNKRGQGASSSETTGWILALIVLVVVALVVWFIFGYFQDTAELTPDQLTRALAVCEGTSALAQNNLGAFCADYKEFKVGNKLYYYNCLDLAKQVSPEPKWAEGIVCDQKSAQLKCLNMIETGQLKEGTTIYLSGKECLTNDGENFFDGTPIVLE